MLNVLFMPKTVNCILVSTCSRCNIPDILRTLSEALIIHSFQKYLCLFSVFFWSFELLCFLFCYSCFSDGSVTFDLCPQTTATLDGNKLTMNQTGVKVPSILTRELQDDGKTMLMVRTMNPARITFSSGSFSCSTDSVFQTPWRWKSRTFEMVICKGEHLIENSSQRKIIML